MTLQPAGEPVSLTVWLSKQLKTAEREIWPLCCLLMNMESMLVIVLPGQ